MYYFKPIVLFCFSIVLFPLVVSTSTYAQPTSDILKRDLSLFGGLCLPIGDYSDHTGGAAKTGFTLGGEFNAEILKNITLGTTITLNVNSVKSGVAEYYFNESFPVAVNTETNWIYFWIMGNVGFNQSISNSVCLHGRGNLGILVENSPQVDMTVPKSTNRAQISSAFGPTLAYGFTAGVEVSGVIDISVRSLNAETWYNIASSGTGGFTETWKQPTAVILLTIGYIFSL